MSASHLNLQERICYMIRVTWNINVTCYMKLELPWRIALDLYIPSAECCLLCFQMENFLHVLARNCLLYLFLVSMCDFSCAMCFVYPWTACQCNGHSQCVNESVCEKCEDLTTGRHCESCVSGFYGDPTNGGSCQRMYLWAVQPGTKSASQSFCTQLRLTCQYFTVNFYGTYFPDSWLHCKASPWDIEDLRPVQSILTVSRWHNKSIDCSLDRFI